MMKMNTTANNIITVAGTATQPQQPPQASTTTIKAHQQAQQPTAILHQASNTISIPATIITTASNETASRLNNNNNPTITNPISNPPNQQQQSTTIATNHSISNHDQQHTITQQHPSSATTTFTIHTPTGATQTIQTLPNNLVVTSAATIAGQQAQIPTVNAVANTRSMIHPVTITGTIIGQPPPPNGAPINAVFIHQDQVVSQKNIPNSAAHTTTIATASNHPHMTLQQNSTTTATVINADNVTIPGTTTVTLQPSSQHHHTTAPIFVQTNPNSNTATPNSAIFHQISHPNSSSQSTLPSQSQQQQQQPTNLPTINLSTSAAVLQQSSQQSSSASSSQSAPPPSQQPQQFQRLKVEDALSYLDQVKFKFNDRPQVYNDFLDIMKEFKSQSIDTPGVIQRVSDLFRGHPELIVGFNTFLPPGYKIEIQSNDQVNVSMPNSTNVVLLPNTPCTPSHMQQSIPAATASAGHAVVAANQNIHQLNSNLVRNSSIASSNQSLHHGGQQPSHHTFANSMSPRNETNISSLSSSTTALSHSSSNQNASFNRIESSSHNHRSGNIESNSRNQAPAAVHHHLANAPQQNAGNVPGTGIEFNHAISYVNRIKNRFLDQPEIYKQFLDILQSYQKEQDNSGQKILTESEVFSKVSKLFENQPDLLQEFSQFLPDAHNPSGSSANSVGAPITIHHNQSTNVTPHHQHSHHHHHQHHHMNNNSNNNLMKSLATYTMQNSTNPAASPINQHGHHHQANIEYVINTNSIVNSNTSNAFSNAAFHRTPKRSLSNVNQIEQSNQQHVPSKRSKFSSSFRESSTPEAGIYVGDLVEYAFFDKLRLAMNSPYNYETFLRCLKLFNDEVVNRSELAQLVHPLFSQCPDLYKRFKEMLNIKEGNLSINSSNLQNHNLYYNLFNNSYMNNSSNSSYHTNSYANSCIGHLEGLSNRIALFRDRRDNDFAEVDFTASKRYGVSYRTIPKSSAKQECSGRTPLCREVLNDTLASFPSWSEDSTFVSSRKTQYEEYVYRCEDERYELDLIIETNLATIRVLESVQRKMETMTPEEKSNFKLDNTLGGSSNVIHINSIKRIYGENSVSVIEGIKNSPANVIPLVLRRLISKDEEWRDAQKHFNRNWRDQNEKYYLKSLDHQGISFKQNDIKFLRSKSLLTEIENIAEERSEQTEQQQSSEENASPSADDQPKTDPSQQLPHMIFVYPDKSMIDVACNLIIHHVKRQTSINKEDKRRIKQLMRHFIPDLFATPRGVLSDDEIEDEPKTEKTKTLFENIKLEKEANKNEKIEITPQLMLNSNPDEEYSLFFVNDYWYLFFRLHYILCERLSKMDQRARQIAAEESKENQNRKSSPSILLGLRNNNIKVEEYFTTLVDMIKQVLDGNLDYNQYEDQLREMFSIHAYIAFTLDKVVQNIVRQLQHIVVDECSQQCTELYLQACKIGSAGGLCSNANQQAEAEYIYQKNIESIIPNDNRYKIIIYKGEGKITIDLLESDDDEDEESTNDGDDDSNVPQSSRTLRSTTKNMSAKEREKCLMNEQKVQELIVEKFRTNPPFLKKYIRKHKGSFDPIAQMNNSDSNDYEQQQRSPKQNEETNSNSSDKEANNINNKDDNNNSNNDKDHNNKSASLPTTNENKTKIKVTNNNNNNNENNNECEFDIHRFKSLIFVQNETVLYRKNIEKTRMSHKKITQSKYKRFEKWYNDWINVNCSENIKLKYEKWLLEQDTTGFRLNQPPDNDTNDNYNNNNNNNDDNKKNDKNINDKNNNNNNNDNNNNNNNVKNDKKCNDNNNNNINIDNNNDKMNEETNDNEKEKHKQSPISSPPPPPPTTTSSSTGTLIEIKKENESNDETVINENKNIDNNSIDTNITNNDDPKNNDKNENDLNVDKTIVNDLNQRISDNKNDNDNIDKDNNETSSSTSSTTLITKKNDETIETPTTSTTSTTSQSIKNNDNNNSNESRIKHEKILQKIKFDSETKSPYRQYFRYRFVRMEQKQS